MQFSKNTKYGNKKVSKLWNDWCNFQDRIFAKEFDMIECEHYFSKVENWIMIMGVRFYMQEWEAMRLSMKTFSQKSIQAGFAKISVPIFEKFQTLERKTV